MLGVSCSLACVFGFARLAASVAEEDLEAREDDEGTFISLNGDVMPMDGTSKYVGAAKRNDGDMNIQVPNKNALMGAFSTEGFLLFSRSVDLFFVDASLGFFMRIVNIPSDLKAYFGQAY